MVTLSTGEKSYISFDDAETYFAKRGLDPFGADGQTAVEGYLTIARDYMDGTYEWIGDLASDTQELAWPRINAKDKDGRLIASDSTPAKIGYAQAELAAIAKANGGRVLDLETAAEVKKVKAGSVEVEFEAGSEPGESQRMQAVDRLLAGYIKDRTVSSGIRSVPLVRV
jgi:hypothetical protein